MLTRRLFPDDWAVWRQVRLCALADSPDAFGSTLSDWVDASESRWRARLEEVPFNIVAFAGDEAIGQAGGTAPDSNGRSELLSMWVAPSVRSSTTAADMVTSVAEWAANEGARSLGLSVRRSNERAIAFYQKVGFAEADEPGDEPAEIAMVRPL